MEEPNDFGLKKASGSLVLEARRRRSQENLGGAEDSITRALKIDPNNPGLWLEFAHLRLLEGNYGQAENLARKATSLPSSTADLDAAAWRVVGESWRQRGRGAEAQAAETRVETAMSAADKAAPASTKNNREATMLATITAVARSQPERIGIEYASGGKDFAVRIGKNDPVTITRSEAQAVLGEQSLRKLDTTLGAERMLSTRENSTEADQTLDLRRLNESIAGQRFIAVPIQAALAQAAMVKLTGSADITALTPSAAMQMLTGMPSTSLPLREAKALPPAEVYGQLASAVDAGSPITLRTQAEYRGAKQDTLVDNRTYTVVGVKEDERAGKTYELTLRNPWGKYMRVDLRALIESGGLESFTIGASRQQQLSQGEVRRPTGQALQSEETRQTALQLAKLVEGFANPSVGGKDNLVMLRNFAESFRQPDQPEVSASIAEKTAVALAQSPIDSITVSRGMMVGWSKPDPAGERQSLFQRDRKELPAGEYRVGNATVGKKGETYEGMVVYSSPIANSDGSLVLVQKNSSAGTGSGREYVAVRMSTEQVPDVGRSLRVTVGEQGKVDSIGMMDRADLLQGRRLGG